MSEFADLFDRPIPQADALEYLTALRLLSAGQDVGEKTAVSTEWVARIARNAAQDAGPHRAAEVGRGSMKKVLEAVKRKGPNAQAHIDKRMAFHQAATSPQRLSVGSVSSRPPMQKAAALIEKVREPYTLAEKLAAAAQQARQQLMGEVDPDEVIAAEEQGSLQQATAENEQLRAQLEETAGMAEEHATAAQTAEMASQATQQQLEQQTQGMQDLQMQAQDAQAQAQDAMQQAQMNAQQAAQEAQGKMNLAIRLQQLRQQLASMAAQDPVAEEGEQAEPIMSTNQLGVTDPNADPAAQAGGDPAAAAQGQDPAQAVQDPSAGGQPPPAAAGADTGGGDAAPPKSKSEKKPETKSEPKGGGTTKTEIKIGSATVHTLGDLVKAKGLLGRGKQLLTGSRANRLGEMFSAAEKAHVAKHGPLTSVADFNGRRKRLFLDAVGERGKSVATQAAAVGTAAYGAAKGGKAIHDKVHPEHRAKKAEFEAALARAVQKLASEVAAPHPFGGRGEALKTASIPAPGKGFARTKELKEEPEKEASPFQAKGIARAVQLLTGSHARSLKAISAFEKSHSGAMQQRLSKNLRDEALRRGASEAASRAKAVTAAHGAEAKKVLKTRLGTAAGVATAAYTGKSLHELRKLQKAEPAQEKAAAAVDLSKAKGIRKRLGEMMTGSRAALLDKAAIRSRKRALHVTAQSVQGKGNRHEVSEGLLNRASRLSSEADRERRNSLILTGGSRAVGYGGGMLGLTALEPVSPPDDSHPRKKTADTQRLARLGRAAAKHVGDTIHALPPPKKIPGHGITPFVKAHKHDAVFHRGHPLLDAVDNHIKANKAMDAADRGLAAAERKGRVDAYHKRVWPQRSGFAGLRDRMHEILHGTPHEQNVEIAKGLGSLAGIGAGTVGSAALFQHKKRKAAKTSEPHKSAAAAANKIQKVLGKDHEKTATEEQLRSDARRAAGRAGILPGSALGALVGRLSGHGGRGVAIGAAGGALAGRLQGRAGFNKRELAADFHMERALTKAKRDRAEKAHEKSAAVEELSDSQIDALYGL